MRSATAHEIPCNHVAAGLRERKRDLRHSVLDRFVEVAWMDMPEDLHVLAHDEHVKLAAVMRHQVFDRLARGVGQREDEERGLSGARRLRPNGQCRPVRVVPGGMGGGIACRCLHVFMRRRVVRHRAVCGAQPARAREHDEGRGNRRADAN